MHYEMGRLQEKSGDLEAAVGCYKKTLSLNPNDPAASEALGRLDRPTQRLEQAG